MTLPQRINLIFTEAAILNSMATEYHYMHRAVHYRGCPFGYLVEFDGQTILPDGKPAGFIIFASIHFTKQRGIFGYPGLPTKWQVLSLARLWLHDDLPHNSETVVISKAIKPRGEAHISLAGYDWLRVHPPKFPEQPYHIRLINSYSDKTYGHEGTIYKAANFERIGEVVSKQRHKNTRGSGFNNHTLIQYVYRLPEPNMVWSEIQNQQLMLFVP